MATAVQVEALRRAGDTTEQMIRRDFRRIWPRLRRQSPDTIRDALLELAPTLSDQYGGAAAAMAADWFESVTGQSARTASTTQHAAVVGSVRAAAGGFYDGRLEDAFERIVASTARHANQAGRETVMESASRHDIRYARAPEPGACAWCLMLSSRGAVYHSRSTAGEFRRFHDDCRCQIEVESRDGSLSYDADALYEQYAAVHRSGDTSGDTAARMREAHGLK